jgi:hypothetical protein
MANTFTRNVSTTVGVTTSTVYTVPSATTAVAMGCHVANLTSAQITVTIKAAGAHVGKDIPIPSGSSLDVLAGSRINLNAADTLTVQSSAPLSADVILSVMERT